MKYFFVLIVTILLHFSVKCQVPCAGAPALNSLTASSTLVCAGSSVQLSFSNTNVFSGLLYAWNVSTVSANSGFNTYTTTYITNSIITSAIQVPTWIQVIITCTNAGISTSILPIYINTATNSISFNSPTICAGQQATLNATSVGTINWYNSASSSISIGSGSVFISPNLNAGTSVFYAEASNACSFAPFRYPATVVVNPTPTIGISNATLCNNQSTYTLVPTGALSYTFSSGSAIVQPSVTSIYTISGMNQWSCTSSSTVQISKLNLPLPTVSLNSGSICPNFQFTFTPSGAQSYAIQGGTTVVSPSVTTQYTVIGTDANGCSSMSSATVHVWPSPTISIANGTICLGQTYTMMPSGAISYTYAGGGPVVSPSITSYYAVIGTDANGCETPLAQMITVYVHTLTPTLSVNSGSICAGGFFTIVPSGASTYTYSSIISLVSPSVTTVYTVSGKFLNSVCTASATNTVVVNPNPSISINITKPSLCVGETSSIALSGASSYTWNNLFTGNLLVVSPTVSTVYSIQAVNVFGCYQNTLVTLAVNECTGTEEALLQVLVRAIFPNPSEGLFYIETNKTIPVQLINTLAEVVKDLSLSEGLTELDLRDLPNGIYYLICKKGQRPLKEKLIKNSFN